VQRDQCAQWFSQSSQIRLLHWAKKLNRLLFGKTGPLRSDGIAAAESRERAEVKNARSPQ
jgi:hypothetical protein